MDSDEVQRRQITTYKATDSNNGPSKGLEPESHAGAGHLVRGGRAQDRGIGGLVERYQTNRLL